MNNQYTELDWSKISWRKASKAYKLYYDNKPLILETPICDIPNNVEQSNNKQILVVCFGDKTNETHNFIAQIKGLDAHIQDTKLYDTKANVLSRSMRDSNKGHTMKLHYKDVDVCHEFNGVKQICTITEFKNRRAKLQIELSLLWCFSGMYGISWNLREICLVD